ncbi:hypothetical protein LguiB_021910 [Lonicera macranthoides]
MNQEFKIPTIASIKKKFPNASPEEIKKKMVKAFISQLGFLDDDDTSPSSKAPSINLEDLEENYDENEDMEKNIWDYHGQIK